MHIDSRKPVTTVHTATGQTYASGDIIVEATTTDADSGITNAVMNLYGAGGLIKSCVNDKLSTAVATYDYTCTLPVASLEDGEYYLRINSHDAAGNVSNTVTWNFVVDTTPPDLFITLPSKITMYSPGTIYVKGTVDATAVGTVGVTFDGETKQTFIGTDGNWAVSFAGTTPGEYSIVATARDAFDNIASVTRENIIVLSVPPSFIVTPVNPELPSTANQNAQNQAANPQNVVTPSNTASTVAVADTVTRGENGSAVLADEAVAATDRDVMAAEATIEDTTVEDAPASRSFFGAINYWWLIGSTVIIGAIIVAFARWRRSW